MQINLGAKLWLLVLILATQTLALDCILRTRLLEPGGWLVLVDLHPAGAWLKLPQQLFCALFETDTATAMLEDDLPPELEQLGFSSVSQELLAGRALQRITATRPR